MNIPTENKNLEEDQRFNVDIVNFHRRDITRVTLLSYRDFIVYNVNLTIFIKYRYVHFVRFFSMNNKIILIS